MKKVLMLASVASMIEQFNMYNICLLQEMGYKVDVACNFVNGSTCTDECVLELKQKLSRINVDCFQVDFTRNVADIKQEYIAYKQVKKIMTENVYDFVHCHSPIGGLVGRIVAHFTKTKVIYTAHGFHFFKGAPILNWLLFYPIEWGCSFWTDVLITINKEDYTRARNRFHAGVVEYIPGVGVDTKKYRECKIDRRAVRQRLGIKDDEVMLFSVGELCDNKNHETVIRALAKIQNNKVKYYICGKGKKEQELLNLAKDLGIEKQIVLLGYRQDIHELCKAADVFVFMSKREGLGLAAIEGMASGLPLISSNIHGIKDYSENGKTGYTYAPKDVFGVAEGINKCAMDAKWRYNVGQYNQIVAQRFDISQVQDKMKEIYSGMECVKGRNGDYL